ncbi:MAG: prepilin peptidase [Rhodovibrionaceae bacterium]
MLSAAVLLVAACGLFLWAAASDLGAYRIPNLCVVAIVLLFFPYSLLGTGLAPLLPHLAAGGAVLLVGIPLYAFGLAGAGDFKLLAAAALWGGPGGLAALLLVMALGGGVLAGICWLRSRRGMKTAGPAPQEGGEAESADPAIHLPYGVAISAGALFVLTQHLQTLLA